MAVRDRWSRIFAFGVLALSAALAAPRPAAAANEHFKEVLQNGVLRVGVQGALRPWSYRDPQGNLVGIEPDLARDVADTMGVKLELVQIESANRMQFLQQGRIDLLIGAMSDTAERRKVVGIIHPDYWISGTNILAKKGAVKSWEDLKGKPVCAKQGLFYNSLVERSYGAHIVSFPGNTETKQALRSGKCIAWLSDDTTIQQAMADEGWPGYEMPLETKYRTPWGAAVPLAEKDGIWGKFMTGMIVDWHASGKLLDLAKKWGVKPDPWLTEQHEKYKFVEYKSE